MRAIDIFAIVTNTIPYFLQCSPSDPSVADVDMYCLNICVADGGKYWSTTES